MIVISTNRRAWEERYTNVVQAGETYQEYAIPYENHRLILIVKGPKFRNLEEIWPKLKSWI